MALHNELGKAGEDRATTYLLQKGYEILQRNYRFGKAEIDIIAKYKKQIIFVEVKTRTNYTYGYPEESVTKSKQKLMVRAASNYLFEHTFDGECRFDVLSVFKSKDDQWYFTHFEDAFFLIDDA